MTDLHSTLTLARTIADSRREDHQGPEHVLFPVGTPDSVVKVALQNCLKGSYIEFHNTPAVWAATVDAQKAAELLDRAEKAELVRDMFQAADYRAAAERKLAEAASWLF